MPTNVSVTGRRPQAYVCHDTVTRPANTTAYAAGDAVSDNATTATEAGVFKFDMMAAGQSGVIDAITIHKSDHDVTNAAFALLLFTELPAYAGFEDNGALAITDAEFLYCVGAVAIPTASWVNAVTGNVQTVQIDLPFVCESDDQYLYGILVATAAYTPASGEVFAITAHSVLD